MSTFSPLRLCLLALTATLVAGCGSTGENRSIGDGAFAISQAEAPSVDVQEGEGSATPEPVSPPPNPTTTSTPTPVPTPAPSPTAVVLPVGTSAVETIYLEPAGERGWPIEAGDWVSHSFSPPLFFTLPEAGTVVGDGAGRLEILIGDPSEPQGHLVLSTPFAISSPGGPIPIDLADEGRAFSGSVVLDSAIVDHAAEPEGGSITLRDFLITADPVLEPFLRPCYRSVDVLCVDPLVTTSGLVYLEVGLPHRVATQDYGEDGRLIIVATPSNDRIELEDFGAIATAVATTAIAAPESTYSDTTTLRALGDRAKTIPAGTYVTRIGDTAINVSLSVPIEDASLQARSPDVLGLESGNGIGWIWFINFAAFAELGTQGRSEQVTPRALAPLPADEFEAGLRARLQILDTGVTTIGGVSAVWFDVTTDPENPAAVRCSLVGWRAVQEMCVTYASTPSVTWYQPSGVVDRYFYIEETGLFIDISPWPGYTIDDVLAAYAPLIEGLDIHVG